MNQPEQSVIAGCGHNLIDRIVPPEQIAADHAAQVCCLMQPSADFMVADFNTGAAFSPRPR